MLMETKKCDANVESQSAPKVYGAWSENALNILTLKYPLKELSLESLTGGFTVDIRKEKIEW